jgi:hypothetical protein
MTTTRHIPGRDLAIGDAVVLFQTAHRIAAFVPYEGTLLELLGEGTRIAIAEGGDWSITVPPAMTVEVLA